MHKLHNKRALVTAGAKGIGLAISRQLLAAGCDVFVHYRSSADAARGLETEARALNRRYAHVAADLTQAPECERLVSEAVKFLGGLDVLVNNAGSLVARRTLAEADDAFWEDVMSLNVGSTRRVTRAATPHLVAAAKTGSSASIVNLSSLSPAAKAAMPARWSTRPRRAPFSRLRAPWPTNSVRRVSASALSHPA